MVKSIFSYDNFRKFLRDVYEHKRSEQAGFSLARFSKWLGFSSPNYASLVIGGKRNLTLENIHNVIQMMKFDLREADYFENLVLWNQSKTDRTKKHYSRKLKMMDVILPKSIARRSSSQLLEEPFFAVVLLALDWCESGRAIERVQQFVDIPSELASKLIGDLLESGLLGLQGSIYRLNFAHQIFHDTKATSIRHRKLLTAQLELSRVALKLKYSQGAKFYSHTASIGEGDFALFDSRIRELLADFSTKCENEPAAEIVQFNVQLFRTTPDLVKVDSRRG